MEFKKYAISVFYLAVLAFLILFLLNMLQGFLQFNPEGKVEHRVILLLIQLQAL